VYQKEIDMDAREAWENDKPVRDAIAEMDAKVAADRKQREDEAHERWLKRTAAEAAKLPAQMPVNTRGCRT